MNTWGCHKMKLAVVLPNPLKLPFSIPVFSQHKLEAALLALGQFQHALAELMAWLTHTEELLDAQKPINGDPKVIEVELAKHHVSVFPLQLHYLACSHGRTQFLI